MRGESEEPRGTTDPRSARGLRILAALLGLAAILAAARPAPAGADAGAEAVAQRRGWGYLVDKLVADGVPRGRAVAVFADPRVPAFDGLSFSLVPREAAGPYRRLQGAASVAAAHRCRARYATELQAAEAAHGVPASVVAAIIHVESACGRNTGASRIFHRLARLAMANAPENLAANLARHAGHRAARDSRAAELTRSRARYLEDTFYPEVRALFTLGDRLGIDPLAMHGSVSGAFGFPQFLPTSYLSHGVDANGDGRVSLYDMADAAASCAKYLADRGWRAGLSLAERRSIIWQYNRSGDYIETVLALSRRLEERAPGPGPVAREGHADEPRPAR